MDECKLHGKGDIWANGDNKAEVWEEHSKQNKLGLFTEQCGEEWEGGIMRMFGTENMTYSDIY